MNELNNLVKQVSDQIPKAGIWLTLTNIRVALDLVFDTIYKLLHLGLVFALIYGAYNFVPWTALINQIPK
jgi:hypothetical protein